MSSTLGGNIDWNNLNSLSIQELKNMCNEKNLRLEGKPTKARYVETLEKYRDAVMANETPKRRGRPPKSAQSTPAQSPAVKTPKKTPKETPKKEEVQQPVKQEVRQVSPPITERVISPIPTPTTTPLKQKSPKSSAAQTPKSTADQEVDNFVWYKSPLFIIFMIFVVLAFIVALKST